MATDLKEIAKFMDDEKLKYDFHPDKSFILTGFAMDNYKDTDGEKRIRMVIQLEENGEFLKVFAPGAYKCPPGPNALAILQSFMYVHWRTKMLQFEYDPSDGEIQAMIELPLEDAKLTKKQLIRILSALPQLVDRYDGMVRTAVEKGKFVIPPEEEDMMAKLLEALGEVGPDGLREALEQIKKKKGAKGGDGPKEL